MIDTRKLFIVTDYGIYLGRESFHKKLAKLCEISDHSIIGGGVFEQKGTHFILFGNSGDFGKFSIDITQYHINNKSVFWYSKKQEKFTFEIDYYREEKESDKF